LDDEHDMVDEHEYAWWNTMVLVLGYLDMFIQICFTMFLPLVMYA